jgi:hypothetical protein
MTAATEESYEVQLQKAFQRVQTLMTSLTPGKGYARATTTDAPMIFVNPWGRWCAKFSLTDGTPYYAFGGTLLEALTRLTETPLHGPADEYK